MKKLIKIKESKILDIIDKIIEEQTTASGQIVVNASNSLGSAPGFDGLKQLFDTLKKNVERALRGATPYKIVIGDRGNVAIARKEGSALRLDVTLAPTTEKDRDFYFDCSVAIYSGQIKPESKDILQARVMEKAATKGLSFMGSKIKQLGRNTIGLSGFKDLDPNDQSKTYSLYIIYISGGRPSDYQDVGDESPESASQKPNEEPTKDKSPVSVVKPKPGELYEVVKGGYTASDCDALHAFQGRKVPDKTNPKKFISETIGNMNVIVGNRLLELYNQGYNPVVTDVKVTVNDMTVNWDCTIKNSPDGNAWVGFTSRGAGCNNDIKNRAEYAQGNDTKSIIENIKKEFGEENIDFEKVSEVNYTGQGAAAKNSFRQIFYVYTKPGKFPAHK